MQVTIRQPSPSIYYPLNISYLVPKGAEAQKNMLEKKKSFQANLAGIKYLKVPSIEPIMPIPIL